MITYEDFEKVDIRLGKIIEVKDFPEAKKPAYKLTIDFGESIGVLRSSAQITHLYSITALAGQQVVAVINFPPKKIAGFKSECLVLGVYNENEEVVLLQPTRPVSNGCKVFLFYPCFRAILH